MDVENYILSGCCADCDQDPTRCLCDGFCFYDHMRETEQEGGGKFND